MTSPNQAEAQREEEPHRQIVRSQDLVPETKTKTEVSAVMTEEILNFQRAMILNLAHQDQEMIQKKHQVSKNNSTKETTNAAMLRAEISNLAQKDLEEIQTNHQALKNHLTREIVSLGKNLTNHFLEEVDVRKVYLIEETANLGKNKIDLFLLEEIATVMKTEAKKEVM